MCCLFGIVDHRNYFSVKEKNHILSVLSAECEERGTDATGIAYCSHDHLSIYKRPLEAHRLHFRVPGDSQVIMGHTRMTTQGMASRNRNNHPFFGEAGGELFALAHNGVLWNDDILRRSKHLPKTKIETDSYIAVQLIEQKNTLDLSSQKYMAEQVEGSFTFTVLDERENLYFVKGDSPMCLYYYPRCGVYLYASTEAILNRALGRLNLPIGKPERIMLDCGDILKLTHSGRREMSSFDASSLMDPWGSFSMWPTPTRSRTRRHSVEQEYLEELKNVAACCGYSPPSVDRLLESGFSTDEIEEFLYEGTMYQ